jgi:hypothetical protein
MIPIPDLTQSEVPVPQDARCASGHYARGHYRARPIRFFRLARRDGKLLGDYCEPCLVVANAVARKRREGRRA